MTTDVSGPKRLVTNSDDHAYALALDQCKNKILLSAIAATAHELTRRTTISRRRRELHRKYTFRSPSPLSSSRSVTQQRGCSVTSRPTTQEPTIEVISPTAVAAPQMGWEPKILVRPRPLVSPPTPSCSEPFTTSDHHRTSLVSLLIRPLSLPRPLQSGEMPPFTTSSKQQWLLPEGYMAANLTLHSLRNTFRRMKDLFLILRTQRYLVQNLKRSLLQKWCANYRWRISGREQIRTFVVRVTLRKMMATSHSLRATRYVDRMLKAHTRGRCFLVWRRRTSAQRLVRKNVARCVLNWRVAEVLRQWKWMGVAFRNRRRKKLQWAFGVMVTKSIGRVRAQKRNACDLIKLCFWKWKVLWKLRIVAQGANSALLHRYWLRWCRCSQYRSQLTIVVAAQFSRRIQQQCWQFWKQRRATRSINRSADSLRRVFSS